ncbi:hypothetical protein SAMN03097708_00712 [Thiohalomonas denitrificans]|uniref:Uncharacterized protein n=1 Tax=Thiohalomonas denitrificans TaxID=415747 RepID=A0A1G5PSC4_9GAMM|nr:hypothetical protein SAMN03097708_00712 [Thiohalomonas denitrificans]
MKGRKLILTAIFVLGLVGGPSALESARSAVPPIDWNAIPFALIGAIVGMLLVLGMQIARRNPKPARVAIQAFEGISSGVLGAGLSALVVSALKYGWLPSGVFFAALGAGLFAGVALAALLFRWRYRDVL